MDAFQKQHIRQSLHSIMHRGNSSRVDEEGCEMHVRVKSKFGDGFQTLLTNVKNMNSWLKKKKKEESPVFGDFVLPGSIYLFHPYIGNGDVYMRYEQMKSTMTTVSVTRESDA